MSLVAADRAHAAPPASADRWSLLDPRPPNHFALRATTLSDFAGVEVQYRRAFGRHVSLGAGLEYLYPDIGYGQLQAVGHTLEVVAWIARPWTGPFFAAEFAVGQNFLFRIPELNSVAVGGGADFGWSWDLPFRLNVGFSIGIRRLIPVKRAGPICSLARECVFMIDEFQPRFALSFGYRF